MPQLFYKRLFLEESVHGLLSIPSVKEKEKKHMHAHFGDVAKTFTFLSHFHFICLIRAMSTSLLFFSKAKN